MGLRLISGAYNGIDFVGLQCFLPQLTYARSGRGTTLLVRSVLIVKLITISTVYQALLQGTVSATIV